MILTLLLAGIMMLGLFLLLFAGVALIQDKKYFASAPKEVYEAVEGKEERFPGQHILGYLLALIAILCMVAPLLIGALNGLHNDFTFLEFFLRFFAMLMLLKLFDIIFFDWYLLCRSNFFPTFYPEVKPLLGPHLFGFNKKDHAFHILGILLGSGLVAGVCSLL